MSGTADLAIEVDRYLHLGTMNLDANLRAKGNVLNNLGSISAKNIYLGFDKQVANLGSFSAENMTVHSNFLNLTGEVYADSSLAMAGFYEANWGLIVTNNYSNNTLFSLNGGLALSNPLIDLEHIFSWGNAVSVGKVIANTLLPKYSDVINLALIAPDLLKRAATFYDAYDNFDLKDCRTMRIHELMPKICQFKSTYLMFRNAFNMTKETPGEFSTLMTDVYNMADWVCDSKTYSMDFLKSVVFLVDWERLGADIISVVSSDYTNNSLIDVNFGVCFAPSMAKKSLFSVNTGVEASLITHNVDTQFLYNSGWSGGGKAVFKAEQGYNLGSLKGFNQLICKADDMINTGLIGGNNADVNIKHLSQKGQLLLNHGQAQILEFDGADNACTKLTDVVVTGKTLFSDGIFHLDDSEIKMTQVHLSDSAQETFKNSILTTTQFIDDSQLSYQGQVTIVTGHYAHNGQVVSINSTEEDAGKNLFYVKAKTADLHGAAALDNAVFDIENFADATHFVSGLDQYNRYAVSEHLAFKTQNDIILDSPFYRDCDLSVRASGITMISDYNKARDLSLSSTAGDVLLLSNITTSNLYVDSAGSIKNNHSIFCNGVANFTAAGIFYNLGGTVNADKVGIQAAGIKNLFATTQNTTNSCFNQFGLSLDTEYLSEVAVSSQNPWAVTMGSSGIINGRTDVYLEATASDIENKGGVIRAGNYAQLIAQGNIINTCAVRPSRSAYDTVYEFDGGLIAGGSGTDTEGVGLYVKAGQKIISDASDFVSNGINYLEGDQGFEFQARQDTHISKIKKSKTQYGQKSKEITTSTTVRNSSVHSAAGCTILVTEHGGIHSVATRFSSPGGTQIKSRDEVQLYSLKTQNNKYKSSSSLWGLSKRSILETHQEALPSLFIDNGVTRIYSTEGAIDARGAYFVGAGDLEMKARGRIKFGVDVLDHEVVDKTRSFEVSAPGMGAWKSWRNGGNLMDAVSAEDASMAKLNSMLRSNNGSELLANSVNLGINLYNTTNSMMRGLASGTLNNELFARYGLGGDKGFSPAISFSMSESETITKYQTQSPGGVDRKGNVLLDAGEGIDLEHGVRVHAGGKMVVNAPEIIATAAALHSSVDQKIASQTIKASITGQMQDFSAGYSHSSTEATNFINAELSADGTMSLGCEGGAMRHVVLDGARIEAGTLDAKIERLDIIDKQDTTVIRNESVNASLLGQISIHKGTGDSAITVQHSGISVVDGINNNGHTVHIDEAHMHGGTILTDGENHIEIDKLITEKVFDHQSYQSIGIGLNVNDLQRLTGKKATNQAGEHAIAIAEVTFDRTDYKAETTTVIHGAQETYPGIKELVGGATAIGTKIIKEQQLHVTLDIPVTNSDYIEQSRANIQAGLDKIVSVIKSNDIPGIEIAAMEEKTRSSRRREEEEEEEEEADGSVEKDKPDTDKESASDNDKIIDEDDLLFSPEEQKALWDGVWTHMSEHDREAIKEDLIALKQQEENGVINPATRDKLEQDIKSAFLQVFKAGATKSWTRFSRKIETEMADKFFRTLAAPDAFSKLTIKTYLGSKGVMIRLAFNLGLKSINNEPDVIKSAITSTAGEISFNILLSYSTGSLAGPVSWTFIGLGILDTLFYDQQYVDKLLEDEVALIHKAQESIKEGKLLQGIAEQMMAADQIQAASQMQAMHYLLVPLSYFGKAYDALWDKIAEPRKAAVFEKPSHYAASSRNSFFRVAEPDVTDKAKYQPCP